MKTCPTLSCGLRGSRLRMTTAPGDVGGYAGLPISRSEEAETELQEMAARKGSADSGMRRAFFMKKSYSQQTLQGLVIFGPATTVQLKRKTMSIHEGQIARNRRRRQRWALLLLALANALLWAALA